MSSDMNYSNLALHLELEKHVAEATKSFCKRSPKIENFADLLMTIKWFIFTKKYLLKQFGEREYKDKRIIYLPYILNLFFLKLPEKDREKFLNLFFQPFDQLVKNYRNKLKYWEEYPLFKPKEFNRRKMKFEEYLTKYGKEDKEYANFMKLLTYLSDKNFQLRDKYKNNLREEFKNKIEWFSKKVNREIEIKKERQRMDIAHNDFLKKMATYDNIKNIKNDDNYEDYDNELQYLSENAKGGNMGEIFSEVANILEELDNEKKIFEEASRHWYSIVNNN